MLTVMAALGWLTPRRRPATARSVLAGEASAEAARKSTLAALPPFDQRLASRQASVRAKVEHVFLILKRDFGFTKTRYRGLVKNLNRVQVGLASANLLMKARAQAIEHRLVAAG